MSINYSGTLSIKKTSVTGPGGVIKSGGLYNQVGHSDLNCGLYACMELFNNK